MKDSNEKLVCINSGVFTAIIVLVLALGMVCGVAIGRCAQDHAATSPIGPGMCTDGYGKSWPPRKDGMCHLADRPK